MRRLVFALTLMGLALPTVAAAADNDQRVADLLAKNLKASAALQSFKIRVQFRDGTARLHGHVRNQSQMDEALAIANRTPQVDRVMNFLKLQTASASRPRRLPEPMQAMPPRPITQVSREQPVPRPTREERPHGEPELRGAMEGPVELQPVPRPQTYSPARRQLQTMPRPMMAQRQAQPRMVYQRPRQRPMAIGYTQPQSHPAMAYHAQHMARMAAAYQQAAAPVPAHVPGTGGGRAPAMYDQPQMPNYSWPTYAAYPNYAALTYPKQYSATAWPYIGPFYPYPQVPLGWRKVTLEWDDGWWFLDFSSDRRQGNGR